MEGSSSFLRPLRRSYIKKVIEYHLKGHTRGLPIIQLRVVFYGPLDRYLTDVQQFRNKLLKLISY